MFLLIAYLIGYFITMSLFRYYRLIVYPYSQHETDEFFLTCVSLFWVLTLPIVLLNIASKTFVKFIKSKITKEDEK